VCKRALAGAISIEALTEAWQLKEEPAGGYSGAYVFQSSGTLSAGLVPAGIFEGTTLGLTVQPVCVFDDYGLCTSAGLLKRVFHATYPRSSANAVRGRSFEH
jgi:hypothetical protein